MKAKAVLNAAARAAWTYATSKEATKMERTLLAGLGFAIARAVWAAIGN